MKSFVLWFIVNCKKKKTFNVEMILRCTIAMKCKWFTTAKQIAKMLERGFFRSSFMSLVSQHRTDSN